MSQPDGPDTELPPSIPPTEEAQGLRQTRKEATPRGGTLLVIVVILVLSALFKNFVVQTYEIPSSSMEDTLQVGDRVAVTMYNAADIERGDVVVFVDPGGWLTAADTPTGWRGTLQDVLEFVRLLPENSGHHLIKRVIGMPGDHVVADGSGSVSVNGTTLQEDYLKDGVTSSDVPFDVTVPAGYVWVMGDNRSNSMDSRFHQEDQHGGLVPLDNVVGAARYVFWPLSRWERIDDDATVLSSLPAAVSLPTASATGPAQEQARQETAPPAASVASPAAVEGTEPATQDDDPSSPRIPESPEPR